MEKKTIKQLEAEKLTLREQIKSIHSAIPRENVMILKIGYSSYVLDGGLEAVIGFLKFMQETPMRTLSYKYLGSEHFDQISGEETSLELGVETKQIQVPSEDQLISAMALDKRIGTVDKKIGELAKQH